MQQSVYKISIKRRTVVIEVANGAKVHGVVLSSVVVRVLDVFALYFGHDIHGGLVGGLGHEFETSVAHAALTNKVFLIFLIFLIFRGDYNQLIILTILTIIILTIIIILIIIIQ